MKNLIIKFLGGKTQEEWREAEKEIKAVKKNLHSLRYCISDWRRGMSYQCKEISTIENVNTHIQTNILNKHL